MKSNTTNGSWQILSQNHWNGNIEIHIFVFLIEKNILFTLSLLTSAQLDLSMTMTLFNCYEHFSLLFCHSSIYSFFSLSHQIYLNTFNIEFVCSSIQMAKVSCCLFFSVKSMCKFVHDIFSCLAPASNIYHVRLVVFFCELLAYD